MQTFIGFKYLDFLPESIKNLNYCQNQIENLDNIPVSIIKLTCCTNKIKSLFIGNELKYLIVDNNVLLVGYKK